MFTDELMSRPVTMAEVPSDVWFVVVALICIPFAELQSITYTEVPANPTYVVEGNNISLKWSYVLTGSVRRIELLFVQSVQGGSLVLVLEYETPNVQRDIGAAYTDRLGPVNITDTQSSITIQRANRTDSGSYQLVVVLSGPRQPSSVAVEVQYPPELTKKSGDQDVVEDDGVSVTLECIANGKPTPNITWTKVLDNGSDSNVLSRENTLILDNNRNNAGKYRCTAHNGIGTAPNHTVNVNVNYKPENIQLIVNGSNICQGDVISITCSADGKPVVHTYQLFENDIPVSDGSSSGVWIRTMSTQGVFTYRCVANNTVGTSDKNVTVTVNEPSSIPSIQDKPVTEGGNVTLTCQASGMPHPMVSWIKLGGQRSNGSVLVLTNINRSEAGEYRCEASNQCGNASEATSIDVQYMPQITHISADQALNKDDRMSLNCTADGNPRPNITWTKVSDNSAVSFPLTITGKENEGQYRCTAQNGVGHTVSKVVSIIVHYPSSIEPLTNMTVEKGKSVTLFCNASGTPVPSVYWTHVSTGKQRLNRTWVLTDIKVDDLGEYKCHARNTFGNDSKSVSIYFAGGKCEVKCTDGTSCREWGQFLCLCNKGKKGPNCEQTDELKTTHTASLEITEEYNPVYEDLENAETKTFVKKIEDNVMEEFKDADIVSVKVTKLRKGSVIADMELTFNETAGESEVEALLSEATKDGKIGTLGVSQVAVGTIIKKPGDGKECGTFFQGEDCKKAKPALIALCVVGGLVVLAILVAIIAYILQRKKAQASINNGHYRAEPDGNPANGERNIGFNNHGNVNTAYENDRPNGESYVSDTPMVTFKSSNPAATPGIEINDSSVTKKSQPGEGTYADLGDFHQKEVAAPVIGPVKTPPAYENTEYAEISQFLRGPVTTNEDTKDKANEDGRNDLRDKESSPLKDYTDVEDEANTFEI